MQANKEWWPSGLEFDFDFTSGLCGLRPALQHAKSRLPGQDSTKKQPLLE